MNPFRILDAAATVARNYLPISVAGALLTLFWVVFLPFIPGIVWILLLLAGSVLGLGCSVWMQIEQRRAAKVDAILREIETRDLRMATRWEGR